LDDLELLQENKEAMCGGPTCTFHGKEIPCHVNVSPNASISSKMLVEMLSDMDGAEIFDQLTNGPKPFLLLDGHHSRMELPFLQYIHNYAHPWVVCIGIPYGTHLWQVADSYELNGAFKIGLTKAKNEIYTAKPGIIKKWLVTDIIPILNCTFPTSFGDVDKAQQAIIDRGWGPLNYALLEHCNVLKTKPVPPDTLSSVSSDQLESASSYAVTTNSNECSVTIDIAKGAAGRAIDAIVQSKVKSVGTRKARKEKKEREEDVATSGERLAKMAKVKSEALAS
jgi:hypothetical protein